MALATHPCLNSDPSHSEGKGANGMSKPRALAVVLSPYPACIYFLPEKKSKGETAGSLPEETREGAGAIQVDLQGSELWKRFHEIGTEMIITKAGR